MSRMLNLCNHLFVQARRLHQIGADHRALRTFQRLARMAILPKDLAEQTQAHLGQIHLKQGEYFKARRHLTAALAYSRDNPEYYYSIARTFEEDPVGNLQKALVNYRLGLKLDPENARAHLDAALVALELGLMHEGLTMLRRAVELAADDGELVSDAIHALQEHDQPEEARRVAIAARFRHGCDPVFQRVWDDFRFKEVRNEQRHEVNQLAACVASAEENNCLSFVELTTETPTGRKLIRRDGPSHIPPPHFVRLTARNGRKHA